MILQTQEYKKKELRALNIVSTAIIQSQKDQHVTQYLNHLETKILPKINNNI